MFASNPRILCIGFLLLWLIPGPSSHSWGFFAHQRINRMAVFTLPPGMFGFYKTHIEYLTAHATDPDRRRYAVAGEAACHYIDLDHYGAHPFDSIPMSWKAAVAKFSEDSLKSYGIVPWHIGLVFQRLIKAFVDEDENRILHYSADLGHYVADAHVPLHTTENYNGQLTNQQGIHGFWKAASLNSMPNIIITGSVRRAISKTPYKLPGPFSKAAMLR